jgi:hypothetical protein
MCMKLVEFGSYLANGKFNLQMETHGPFVGSAFI